jgi:hypothetical protein
MAELKISLHPVESNREMSALLHENAIPHKCRMFVRDADCCGVDILEVILNSKAAVAGITTIGGIILGAIRKSRRVRLELPDGTKIEAENEKAALRALDKIKSMTEEN